MKTLNINTNLKYKINITDSISKLSQNINTKISGDRVLIISDSNVAPLYFEEVKNLIKEKEIFCYTIKSGENSKSIKNYSLILNYLAEKKFNRNDTIVALGGGVVSDLSGFIASTYMRGISLLIIPTSLLAMIDASVGGKTAINIENGKNLCGTFYQPNGVYIATDFLKTLNKKQIKSGLGELLKYSFIDKSIKFDFSNLNEKAIASALKIKKQIVEQDEREKGKRKLLNFGHTFAHAIERVEGFKLTHGECVAKGILYSLIISKNYYGYGDEIVIEYKKIAKSLNINLDIDYNTKELIKNIEFDKKKNSNGIDFVLIDKERNLQIVNIDIEKIVGYLGK